MWGAAPTRGAFRAPLAAFLAAAATAAAFGVVAGPADAGLRALYVSPKGSDRSLCTRQRPCRSFARAYRVARPGQTVFLRAGTYRGQSLGYDWKKRSARKVLFRPVAGRKVTIRGPLNVSARYVEFRGFRVGSWVARSPAGHVIFRSVSAGHFVVEGASDVSVIGGTLGPSTNRANVVKAKSSTSVRPPRNLLLSGVTVRGYRSTTAAATHCLEVRNALGLTVRNSRFLDCDGSAVFFAEGGFAGAPANVILENNVFGRTDPHAVYLAGARGERWFNFLVRNNSTDGEIAVSSQSRPLSGLDFYSNIASAFSGCGRTGVAADYNVWAAGSACGSSDVVAPARFVDPAAGNYDLLPGSAAIDLSAEGRYAATDLSGGTRPIGELGDAGAYESNSSGLVAAYPLNESAGSVVRDASSLGNAGAVTGASWTASGRYGGALSFDGLNDWVTVADAASLDMTSSLTLEAWVKADANGSVWRTVLMKEQPGGLTYGLYSDTNSGKPSGNVNVGTELDTRAVSGLPLNAWTHLATTYDGSMLRLFMNGKEVSSRSVSGSLTTSAGALRLGGNSIWDEWFDGAIDEVRVYKRPLSARQVKKDMNSAIRIQADTQAPTAPGALSGTAATTSSISVAWTPSTDDVGVAGYGLYRNGSLAGSASGLTYTFTGLSCGTTYTLEVDAFDGAGNRSGRTATTASTAACPPPDTQAPSAPSALNATGTTATSVSVAWTASTDDVAVAGYELFRNGTSAGTTAAATYTFSALTCGTSYTLGVEAYDAAGNHSSRTTLTASTSTCPAPDTQAPTAPGGFATTSVGQTSVAVSWNAATDNVGVTGYEVFRNGTSAGTTASGTRSFTFSSLACGASYTLGVEAYDAAGNHSSRTTLTAATTACSSPGSANFYVSASGSDSNPCTQAAPCRSFDRAYDRAAPGDVIQAAAGTYSGNENVNGDKGSTVPVVIEPAVGALVTVTGDFSIVADYVTVRRIRAATGWGIDNSDASNPIVGVRLENVSGRNVFIQNARNPVVTGSDLGPFPNHEAGLVGASPASYNVTFSNNTFHDTRPTDNTVHVECIEANNVQGLNVLNNRFERCGYFGILPGRLFETPEPRELRLEGNYFGQTYNCDKSSCSSEADWGLAPYSTMFGADHWGGASFIRNNFFETPPGGTGKPTFDSLTTCGNTGAAPTIWAGAC